MWTPLFFGCPIIGLDREVEKQRIFNHGSKLLYLPSGLKSDSIKYQPISRQSGKKWSGVNCGSWPETTLGSGPAANHIFWRQKAPFCEHFPPNPSSSVTNLSLHSWSRDKSITHKGSLLHIGAVRSDNADFIMRTPSWGGRQFNGVFEHGLWPHGSLTVLLADTSSC